MQAGMETDSQLWFSLSQLWCRGYFSFPIMVQGLHQINRKLLKMNTIRVAWRVEWLN